ncbi:MULTISPECIES: MarR family winged helix-turn-helix transcriptional regulator [Pantoea]|jgi:DNA-binding MarR family transcriptional regulator|uniref:Winged helix-turn-helix transcriptional regulator n=1 Tax=Pantoea dispersa TaxID=59814 RepID=A0ABY3A2W9_9GAMM|nr:MULTISPECIES: MarR family winged helix-turn-helix transcriptional regulator [Pantoea]MBK4771509.1 winged helix-turn-helix transcriptional regulator [Pantoea sp. Morm]ERH62719.1 MarR family transcriptional regulator [Pantoea dispersa EGD-AAK13]KAA6099934.1 winged helix-turn-helix transcriptional regulator [Pantoea sp. B_9]KAA6108424.1 winged helix-turn-helix transcriptional regulator [Pantoea sp. B_10]KAA8673614.1 winged helix-turn-helix transcriptional regulator [Pantoea dispersa]
MSHQQDPRADQRYDYTEQVGHLLRKVYQRHAAIFQQHVGDSQITAVQFITLCALRDRGPSAQNDLVRYTAVDQATIRGVVERLKARDLVSLGPDPTDKRKVIVMLTDAGHRLIDSTTDNAMRITEMTYGQLNPAERVALIYLLKKMLDDTSQP